MRLRIVLWEMWALVVATDGFRYSKTRRRRQCSGWRKETFASTTHSRSSRWKWFLSKRWIRALAMACSFGLEVSRFSIWAISGEDRSAFTPLTRAGCLLPDKSASLCSRKRCFSMFWVPRAEKSVFLAFGNSRQGLQTHFLFMGKSRA